MKSDDIEQLLQQYGDDQRQQQKAAEHMRRLAHRQARRSTALLCTLLVLTMAGVALYRFQSPKPSTVIALRQPAPAVTIPAIPAAATPSESDQIPLRASQPHHQVPSSPIAPISDTAIPSAIPEAFVAHTMIPVTLADTLPTQPAVITPVPAAEPPRIDPSAPPTHIHDIQKTLPPNHSTNRQRNYAKLRMTAAIGAATMGSGLLALAEKEDASFQMANEVDASYSRITPTSMVHAEVGLTYVVAANDRRHLNVGLGISGYSHQSDYHMHDISYIQPESGTDGFLTNSNDLIPNVTDDKYSLNTLSLYVSMPLTIDLHPRGREKAGWQFRITPAHSIISSGQNTLGVLQNNNIGLNPWKLTLGIGLALPSDFVRDISLTANLLPVYSHSSFHEFGIRIGF